MKTSLSGRTVLLMNLILAQVLVVILNGMWGIYAAKGQIKMPVQYITGFSLMAGFILAGASIYIIREILRLAEKETEAELTAVNIRKNEELIGILRTQRHDFLNHIQVIYGLAKLNKIEKLSSYIGCLTSDIETENSLSTLCHIEFAAFLVRKKSLAIEQGVKFEIDIFTDLACLEIPANELVSIAGNLIDNAFFAVEISPDSDSEVLLTIDEGDSTYIISVANTGPGIPDEVRLQMFKRGFTTKKERGSGLGLYIVSELVKKNQGTVELVDEPGFSVCFQVEFPRNQA